MAAVIAIVAASMAPALGAGFWSWDWYWIDEHARGNTVLGGPFYDIANHANPLPFEVQWYRVTLVVLGLEPFAHHLLTLAGLLATIGMLYLLMKKLDIPRWAGIWAVVVAGVAPASLTSWTWFAASPHMWAALLGLAAAVVHITWRERGSHIGLLMVAAPALSILGLAMKNDAVIGPLLILAWEWFGRDPRTAFSRTAKNAAGTRVAVSAAAILPMLAFVWWQGTAVDPHRDQATTSALDVAGNTVGLLRFAFLWQTDAELRAEFPPAPAAPIMLLVAGALVGAAVLVLAAVSLRTKAGRVLIAAGIAALGPVAVLQPALLSRYALPPVLLLTAAAGAGAGHLFSRRLRLGESRNTRVVLAVAAIATIACWGTLAHLAGKGGAIATDEEEALLAGLKRAGFTATDKVAVKLVDSPVEPTTAAFRQFDPRLPADRQLRGLTFLQPGQSPSPGTRVATATRLASGAYEVTLTG